MKYLLQTLSIIIWMGSYAQVPQAFNYQAQARDSNGDPLVNQSISIRISILNGSTIGAIDYREIHNISTDEHGLFYLIISNGTVESGIFTDVDWSGGLKFLKVEMDQSGGSSYVDMGTVQLLSVPFAIQAETVVNDKYIDDDNDILNEIQDLDLTGDILKITNNAGASSIDLSPYKDNTDTQLSEAQVDALVSNNGYLTAEIDGSITNEIQDLDLTGDILKITNNAGASSIDLSPYKDTYTAGAGIDITNNVISSTAVTTFFIGLNTNLGGYVFYVTPDGKHGLVASMQEISPLFWYDMKDALSNPVNYDNSGQNFTDWRLPTRNELDLIYSEKDNMGGFLNSLWSSIETVTNVDAWFLQTDGNWFQSNKTNAIHSRPVRSF